MVPSFTEIVIPVSAVSSKEQEDVTEVSVEPTEEVQSADLDSTFPSTPPHWKSRVSAASKRALVHKSPKPKHGPALAQIKTRVRRLAHKPSHKRAQEKPPRISWRGPQAGVKKTMKSEGEFVEKSSLRFGAGR